MCATKLWRGVFARPRPRPPLWLSNKLRISSGIRVSAGNVLPGGTCPTRGAAAADCRRVGCTTAGRLCGKETNPPSVHIYIYMNVCADARESVPSVAFINCAYFISGSVPVDGLNEHGVCYIYIFTAAPNAHAHAKKEHDRRLC